MFSQRKFHFIIKAYSEWLTSFEDVLTNNRVTIQRTRHIESFSIFNWTTLSCILSASLKPVHLSNCI